MNICFLPLKVPIKIRQVRATISSIHVYPIPRTGLLNGLSFRMNLMIDLIQTSFLEHFPQPHTCRLNIIKTTSKGRSIVQNNDDSVLPLGKELH